MLVVEKEPRSEVLVSHFFTRGLLQEIGRQIRAKFGDIWCRNREHDPKGQETPREAPRTKLQVPEKIQIPSIKWRVRRVNERPEPGKAKSLMAKS
jgi:hypothetical protein